MFVYFYFFYLKLDLFINFLNRPSEENRQASLERQIDFALSMNYEHVRNLFNKIDLSNSGTISTNELRSIVEDLIQYTLKPDEYYQLLKQIPMDENKRIKYKEYLKQVLDRTLYLQEQQNKILKFYFYFILFYNKNFSFRNLSSDSIKERNIHQKMNLQELKQLRETYLNQSLNSINENDDQKQKSRNINEVSFLFIFLIIKYLFVYFKAS